MDQGDSLHLRDETGEIRISLVAHRSHPFIHMTNHEGSTLSMELHGPQSSIGLRRPNETEAAAIAVGDSSVAILLSTGQPPQPDRSFIDIRYDTATGACVVRHGAAIVYEHRSP